MTLSKLAPVVIFTYNRPWHTRQTIEALQKNELAEQSDVIIFSDAPKNEQAKDSVEQVRAYLKTVTGFNSITIIERTENFGLAKSIITGVTEIVNQYGKIIVLEDDLVTSPYFLRYMNDGLEHYQAFDNVASIHGYIYPIKKMPTDFFIKGADCWGWATWADKWAIFEPDGQKLLNQLVEQNLTREFDFNNTYPYTQMLKDQIAKKNDSWAVRWYASAFLKNMLTLYPAQSHVQNIGHDEMATHTKQLNTNFTSYLAKDYQFIQISTNENLQARKAIEHFFASQNSYVSHIKKLLTPSNKLLVKKTLKQFIPPIILEYAKNQQQNGYGWHGDFESWQQAESQCQGYADNRILEKVKTSLLKVKNGEVVYERDSVIFDEIQYSWELLAGLMYAGTRSKGKINVLDFGGSLGSSYFQNKKFLDNIEHIRWNVIEQPNFVKVGQESFADNQLNFYFDIESCLKEQSPNVLLLASVLQYLEKPYQILEQLLVHSFECIIIDRTPFAVENRDIIKIQRVPPSVYEASYPCHFFDEDRLVSFFELHQYRLVEQFVCQEGIIDGGIFKGIILEKYENA